MRLQMLCVFIILLFPKYGVVKSTELEEDLW